MLTVGGTNGKGSVCAYLDAMLRAAGYDVGLFTSPHLVRYNERIRIGGREVGDAAIVAAFARIDEARGDISLTFFEWNTLAALLLFAQERVDVARARGRHGRTAGRRQPGRCRRRRRGVGRPRSPRMARRHGRGPIGAEKAGIFRAGPARDLRLARRCPKASAAPRVACGARLRRFGRDFDYVERADGWDYVGVGSRRRELPLPALAGSAQLRNAATALAVLEGRRTRVLVPTRPRVRACASPAGRAASRSSTASRNGSWTSPTTRMRRARSPRACRAPGARPHHRGLRHPRGQGHRSHREIACAARIQQWIAVGLPGPRALASTELAQRIAAVTGRTVDSAGDVEGGLRQARAACGVGDRVLVFGSFLTVGPALGFLGAAA